MHVLKNITNKKIYRILSVEVINYICQVPNKGWIQSHLSRIQQPECIVKIIIRNKKFILNIDKSKYEIIYQPS